MQKLIALTIFFLLFSLILQAQNKKFDVDMSKIKEQKHHIELDIKTIFSGLYNSTILYKRRLNNNPTLDGKGLKLIRFSGRFSSTEVIDNGAGDILTTFNPPYDRTIFSGGIGIEKQKSNKHFFHYFGVDGSFNFSRYISTTYLNNNNTSIDFDNFSGTLHQTITYSYGAGLMPFFGLKYYITNSLSFGIETGFFVGYTKENLKEYNTFYVNGTIQNSEKGSLIKGKNSIVSNFTNLRFLTVGFNF